MEVVVDRFTNLVMCFAAVPPRWILEPTDKAFAQGSDAKIECKADGFPKPAVTWKRAAGTNYFQLIFEILISVCSLTIHI